MKNTILKKSFLNSCILFAFGLLLMFPLGCQSDFEEIDTTLVKQQNFKTRIIPLDEISQGQNEIRSFIKATNEASSDSRVSIPGAIFDERNIMEATDSTGIINYSTKFNYVNDPENIFYNLVLNVLPNGQKTSYIFKYTCNLQDFQKYKLSNYNYNNFIGVTEMKNYIDPATQTGTSNRSSPDCEPVLIPSPGTSATPNTGGGSGGGTSVSTQNTTIVGYTVNNHVSGFSVSWGGNTTYAGGGTSIGTSGTHGSCVSMGGGMFIFLFGEVINPHHHKNGNITGRDYTYNPDCIRNTVPLGLVAVNNMVSASYDLRTILNLTRDQFRWLAGKEYIAVDLKNYVLNHWTVEGKAFAVELINQMMQTGLSFENLMAYTNASPNFKMRKTDQLKYPKFKQMLVDLKSNVQSNPQILTALIMYSGLTEAQVLTRLTFDQGPTINLVGNLNNNGLECFGIFDHKTPHLLNINANFALGMETANLQETIKATSFLMAITILHELVHYGNFLTGYDTNGNETGNLFEIGAFGVIISKNNAGEFLTQFRNR